MESADTALSLRVTSVAGLAGGGSVTSADALSIDAHANTVSSRVVSVSAELASLLASTSAQLRADITSVAGLVGGGSVTSAELNAVSARVVSVSAELASLLASTSAQLRADITSVAGIVGGASMTSNEVSVLVQTASAAATSADAHANTVALGLSVCA